MLITIVKLIVLFGLIAYFMYCGLVSGHGACRVDGLLSKHADRQLLFRYWP